MNCENYKVLPFFILDLLNTLLLISCNNVINNDYY